jgi:hypothetical protein
MECKGRLIDVSADYKTLKRRLTFEVDNCSDESLNALIDQKNLKITAVQYNEKKRSLSANSYFWVLLDKIKKAQRDTNDIMLHDKYLSEHRAYVYDESGTFVWKVSPEKANEFGLLKERAVDGHYIYWVDSEMIVGLSKPDGSPLINKRTGEQQIGHVYWRIKGTHEMNTTEMSRLLDDVVTDAKALGIETIPPEELERLLGALNEQSK